MCQEDREKGGRLMNESENKSVTAFSKSTLVQLQKIKYYHPKYKINITLDWPVEEQKTQKMSAGFHIQLCFYFHLKVNWRV